MKTKMESICSVPRSPPQVPCVLRSFRFLLQGLEGKDHSIMVSVLVRVPEEHPERFSFMMVTMVLHSEELSFHNPHHLCGKLFWVYVHTGVNVKILKEAKAKQKVGPGVNLLGSFQAGREDRNQQTLVHTFAI